MEIYPLLLAKLLLYSFALGVAVGAFYDTNRIIRVFFGAVDVTRINKKSLCIKLPFTDKCVSSVPSKATNGFLRNTVVFIGDFLTLILGMSGLLILNYAYNSGKFRFFTAIGALVGFLFYYFTFGKLTFRVLSPIAFFAKYLFFAFFVVLWAPFKFFLRILIKNIRKIYFLCYFVLEKRRKKEYNIYERVYLLEMSKNGFIGNPLTEEKEELSKKKQEV